MGIRIRNAEPIPSRAKTSQTGDEQGEQIKKRGEKALDTCRTSSLNLAERL